MFSPLFRRKLLDPLDPRFDSFAGPRGEGEGDEVRVRDAHVAPGGFEDDGFMLKLLLGGGAYRYNAGSLGGEKVIGTEWMAQALPGSM